MSERRRNPEALHEAAAGWREMGKHLDGMVRDLDRHVGAAAAANWHGPAGEGFAAEWHGLRRSVDDSLPAFELAAADLDNAASQQDGHPDEHKDDQDHAAPQNAGGAQSSSGNGSTTYGFMAFGQLANGLGSAFSKRGGKGGGGQRQGPVVTHQWETSAAAHGSDPFGGAKDGEAKTRGGEGLAKGVRSEPGVPEAAPAPAPAPAAAPASAKQSKDQPAKGPAATTPDTGRHGAFG
ncbi:WXG100 family type VII secretion target [Streptomyces natalensis]|uniref:Uncharacterized protein n=1 Tax=Streptomyces natalensis ATCC 27448 TaxID=1240678 RepID=A0A0D7CCR1_9ACTN|nr:WXG100 family type VII secretion target [Streptomyces natalensis]KIZ13806.1 hypothetical protein SNA_32195 [Streptomyces natalensis ATCC 27448]